MTRQQPPWVEPVTLVGERATLLPLQREHAPALFEAGRDPRIWTYMPARISSLEEMERLVVEALAAQKHGTEIPFTILDQHTERVVGSTRLCDIQPAHRGLEIGWTWLAPEVWRTRVNTECKYLLLRHCFETLGAVRVQLKTDARNLRSQQAIERLGAVREGVLRRHRILPDGFIRDSVYYSILDAEWPSTQKRLQSMLGYV